MLGLRMLACEGSEDVWLRWVHVVDDAVNAEGLTGGELVLTTGRRARTAADGDRFVGALVRQGVAALGVAAQSSRSVPYEVISPSELAPACERWRLPLVEIPETRTCEKVAEIATTLIVDRRSGRIVASLERERAFAAALSEANGQGLAAVLDVLQRETDRPLWLLTRGAVFTPRDAPMPPES